MSKGILGTRDWMTVMSKGILGKKTLLTLKVSHFQELVFDFLTFPVETTCYFLVED